MLKVFAGELHLRTGANDFASEGTSLKSNLLAMLRSQSNIAAAGIVV